MGEQIRNTPIRDTTKKELNVRAAMAGMSLTEYLEKCLHEYWQQLDTSTTRKENKSGSKKGENGNK